MKFLQLLKDNNIFREATGNMQIDYMESLKDIKIVFLHNQGSFSFIVTALHHKGYDYNIEHIQNIVTFIENNSYILEKLFNELDSLT